MSDNEMTEYLRSVEGRLSRVEESVGQYKVERAEIRKDLAELKESIAKQSEALIQWQRTVDVTLAGRSVLERLGWLVIGSIVTGAVTLWWNLWR